MSVVERYLNPFNEIRKLENEVADLFRNFDRSSEGFSSLPIDIEESNDEYLITAEIPGVDRDMIDIEATSQYLEVEITRREEVEEEKEEGDDGRKFLVREISTSNMRRRIAFDKPVDPNEASTTMKNGMLKITMPKMETAKSVKLEPDLLEA